MTRTLTVTFSKKAYKHGDLACNMIQTWNDVEYFNKSVNHHELQFCLSDGTEVRVLLKYVLMWELKDNRGDA